MDTVPTYRLIVAAQGGDATAIHTLITRYQPDAARFARTVCATPEDAEDAVQEALWIASQKIGTLRVASTFISWLFQIVKRECFRLLRSIRQETFFEQHTASTPHQDAPDHILLTHDLVRSITNHPPLYRQVLILRDVQGMTAPEAAATLGLSVEAVKSRLHRARSMVRVDIYGWRDLPK